ncbi:hypothetical protein PHYBOEH_002007 [Phytophthora boehmeriae]|uniref:M96 mating-specific protein family n=1 Tax=Phytophthora boehmeriae TaxID=109152 RepID=A0A8T1V6U3_9STRA|nr:hypothetical protein PHYBOEH_002007 [Phytophthora boehmeriae]
MDTDGYSLLLDKSSLNLGSLSFPTSMVEEMSQDYDFLGNIGDLSAMWTDSTLPQSAQSLVDDTRGDNTKEVENLAKKEQLRLRGRIRRRAHIQRRKWEKEALLKDIDDLSKLIALKGKAETNVSPRYQSARKTSLAIRDAVEERQRLRAEVRKYAALIEEFRRKFTDLSGSFNERIPGSDPHYHLKCPQTTLFQQYTQELSTVYSETGDIFQACAADMGTCSSRNIRTIQRMEGTTTYYQSCVKQSIPFEYRQTCDILWQLAHMVQDRAHYRQVDDQGNTAAVEFRIPGDPSSNQEGSLLVHLVIRRYEEKGRMVLVWRALTEGEGFFNGMNLDETGWCSVAPSAMSDSCAVVEICIRSVPVHVGTATSQKTVENQFTDMVLKTTEEDVLAIAEKLETLLLDEALEGIEL